MALTLEQFLALAKPSSTFTGTGGITKSRTVRGWSLISNFMGEDRYGLFLDQRSDGRLRLVVFNMGTVRDSTAVVKKSPWYKRMEPLMAIYLSIKLTGKWE